MPEPALRVFLLGQFQTAIGAVVLRTEVWRRKKASDVVKLLALQPQAQMAREQVLEALWPELDEKSGMNNLHQNLHHARRLLEPNLTKGARPRFLVFERNTLMLCADGAVEVDYQEFKRWLARARRQPSVAAYEAAVALYAGDLLPQDLYEDWTEPLREEARTLYLEALLELAGLLEAEGNFTQAIHYLEQAIAKERTHEAAHLALMQIYARMGRRMEAIQQFQTLREALVQELGEEPDQATRAVYEQILVKLPSLPSLEEPDDQTLPTPSGQVPAALTPLIGREQALDETLQLLSATRCLTLTGAGGSGKTRLALELSTRLQPQYEGGVWWVELVGLSDPGMLMGTIAQALAMADPNKPALQTILERLKGRKALLVLDNCEHLIEASAEAAVTLLKALPGLQILATSRESLRIAGEIAWVVPPLEVPNPEDGTRPDDLARLESVRLLVERIRQHNPRFKISPQNAPSLVQICRRLEGLPLAIELAAARVGPLTVEQIAARLDNSLRLLTRGERGGMRHHQTLRAALEWSYNLLGEAERNLFVRLSVFVGGWTLEAAEAMVSQDVDPHDVPDLLSRLVRASMLVAIETSSGIRYRMLEPIRQFGFAQLEELGLADQVHERLLDWYAKQAEAIAPRLSGQDQAYWYSYLTSEYENIRSALVWAKAQALEPALRMAARLWRFWQVKGHAQEMLGWFEESLSIARGVSAPIKADAYNSAGIMARTCGEYARSTKLYEQALALRRELGDRRGEAITLNNLGVSARDQADYAMVEHFCRQSLTIAREIGDSHLIALGLLNLGVALQGQENLEAARTYFQESLERFSAMGDQRSIASVYNHLGNIALHQHNPLEAERFFWQSHTLNRELEDFWGLGISTQNLATLYLELSHLARAAELLQQSFTHYRKAGVRHGLEDCFETLALLAQKQGQPRYAVWAWGVVERLETEMQKQIPSTRRQLRQQNYSALENTLGSQAFSEARSAGHTEPLEQVFRRVLGEGGLD